MSSFDVCYNWMMNNEDRARACKIVPDPTAADPSAQAISGINSAYYPKDFARIAAVSQDQRPPLVQAFYKFEFWNTWFDRIVSDEVAKRVLDAAVNMGLGTGVKLLQRAVNSSVSPSAPRIAEDGGWGPATLNAANGVVDGYLVIEFKRVRLGYYQDIVLKDPTKLKFLGTPDKPGPWWIRATA